MWTAVVMAMGRGEGRGASVAAQVPRTGDALGARRAKEGGGGGFWPEVFQPLKFTRRLLAPLSVCPNDAPPSLSSITYCLWLSVPVCEGGGGETERPFGQQALHLLFFSFSFRFLYLGCGGVLVPCSARLPLFCGFVPGWEERRSERRKNWSLPGRL